MTITSGPDEIAIQVDGLVKRFGEQTAVDRVDLAVPTGSVFGLLGPNGAGKTTIVRILATLLRPDAGRDGIAGACRAFRLKAYGNDEKVRRNAMACETGPGLWQLTGL